MKRYSVRGVTPRRRAASFVLSHSMSAVPMPTRYAPTEPPATSGQSTVSTPTLMALMIFLVISSLLTLFQLVP